VKSAKKPKPQKEITLRSECGKFFVNPVNEEFLVDPGAVTLLNSLKQTVFRTYKDFEENVIQKLNKNVEDSGVSYVASTTSKYVVIKCGACKKFAFWFKNVDDIDMDKLKESEVINIKFFRSINQNHLLENHSQIDF